jgi:hypothetical protein
LAVDVIPCSAMSVFWHSLGWLACIVPKGQVPGLQLRQLQGLVAGTNRAGVVGWAGWHAVGCSIWLLQYMVAKEWAVCYQVHVDEQAGAWLYVSVGVHCVSHLPEAWGCWLLQSIPVCA